MQKIIYSIIVLVIAILINFLSSFVYRTFLSKRLSPRNNTITLLILNIIRYTAFIISILIIATIFKINMTTLLAGAGFLGILLGIGMQKLLQDMISGFFIIFENHYVVGEYVQINGITGEVLEIGLKTTRLKTYEGELYLFSNGNIDNVLNYSRYPSLSLVEIHIPYKYKPQTTIDIVKSIIVNFDNKLITSNVEVLGIQEVHTNYYNIRITCYTKPYNHFIVNRQLKAYILNKLVENDIYVNIDKVIEIKK